MIQTLLPLISGVTSIFKSLGLSPEAEKEALARLEALKIEQEKTIQTEIKAKSDIVMEELRSGDKFTKRARPAVVYFGLGVIGFNYCVAPMIQLLMGETYIDPFHLPDAFWMAWAGVVGTWSIGRSVEKIKKRDLL